MVHLELGVRSLVNGCQLRLPLGVSLGATWDIEILQGMGELLAEEACHFECIQRDTV